MDLTEFRHPGVSNRMAPFWSWNDNLDSDELVRQIEEMADKGWGGFFMHSRVGLVTEYLSEDWMDKVKVCAQSAQKLGLDGWLYDEDKFPSGYAGGEVPRKDPSYRSRVLILLDPDEIQENDTPMLEVNIDGHEKVICKKVFNLDDPWFNGTCYVDAMNSEAIEYFIECTHERYKEECGDYFGDGIVGIFTDEPCYLRRSGIDHPILPWTDTLPEYFYKEKGYRIEDHLIDLFYDRGDYQRIRFDYYDCISRLFLDSYTKQYYKWCDENNLKMTGHLVAEDTMTAQTRRVGSVMPHYEFMHWPGIDKLGRSVDQPVTVKQLSSVTEQLGKERALCEVFGCIGQHASFFHRKWIADWMAVLGVNYMNPHLSLYSMRGERKRDYPPNFFYQQPWWDQEADFGDYIGRLCYAAAEGEREVDILMIHPIASVWSEYSPLHADTNFMTERHRYDAPFARMTELLMSKKLDFHYGDETIMKAHAYVEDGKLVIGKHQYSTVIIPPALTLRSKTVELLEEFVDAAGKDRLILMKPYPTRIDGRLADISLIEKGQAVEWTSQVFDILDEIYPERLEVIDTMSGRNCSTIISQERTSSKGRWILLANMDEKREVDTDIRIPGTDIPVILDMASGNVFEAPYKVLDGKVHISAKFYPAGSLLLYFPREPEKVAAAKHPKSLSTGVSFPYYSNAISEELIIEDWDVKLLEPNVIPLDKITLYIAGKKVLENQPIFKAWNHFYRNKEGVEFKVEYPFEVVNIPSGDVFAAIEVAENLDKITLNGHVLTPLKTRGELGAFDSDKSWKDINFTKVPLKTYLQKGNNKLIIEGKKVNNVVGTANHIPVSNSESHYPTEIEAVYLVGEFDVRNEDSKLFSIDRKQLKLDSKDLTISGYPFYAGKAEFTREIDVNKIADEAYLEIFDVEAACIELYINGEHAGTRYWDPYIFKVEDLLKEGSNDIKIVASTTLFNLMGPNWNADIEDTRRVTPHAFRDSTRYTEKYALRPFGIGGAKLNL